MSNSMENALIAFSRAHPGINPELSSRLRQAGVLPPAPSANAAGQAKAESVFVPPQQVAAVTPMAQALAQPDVAQVTPVSAAPAKAQWWTDPRAQAGGLALFGALFTFFMTRPQQRSHA